jgi:uncharacterized protein
VSESTAAGRPIHLNPEGARALHLAAQGLIRPAAQPATKRDVLAMIRRMGALQIDSISIVARSPYLVLWSRLGPYDSAWLDDLLARGQLFEYWSHAACFLPSEDWPLYRRDMLERHGRTRHWLEEHDEIAQRVLAHLRSDGPARSSVWARADGLKATGWWDWKPEKIALEALFSTGELMVARRENFQRVYDLRERILPNWSDAGIPTEEEARRGLALKSVRALGVTKARWVPDYFKRPVKGTAALLERLADEGLLLRAHVDGWEVPGYIHLENARLARQAARGTLRHESTTLLSPFDPVVWDRTRLLELWGFHYRIEVYTPALKRRYGYYTLPILHRGRLVGRLDPKAHRADGVLEIRRIHLEEGIEPVPDLVDGLVTALTDFAGWQQLDRVETGESDPPELASLLKAELTVRRSTTTGLEPSGTLLAP